MFVVLVVVEVVVSEVVEAVAVVEVVVDCPSEAELLLLFLLTPCETTKLVPRPRITKISCTSNEFAFPSRNYENINFSCSFLNPN